MYVQVNSGMYASFAQYIGAIVLDEEAIAKALVDSLTAAAAASQVKKQTKKPSSALQGTGKGAGGGVGPHKNDMSGGDPILGKLLVMGNVTKKLVLIPDYPIGKSVYQCIRQYAKRAVGHITHFDGLHLSTSLHLHLYLYLSHSLFIPFPLSLTSSVSLSISSSFPLSRLYSFSFFLSLSFPSPLFHSLGNPRKIESNSEGTGAGDRVGDLRGAASGERHTLYYHAVFTLIQWAVLDFNLIGFD